jgi:exonuclease SbcC
LDVALATSQVDIRRLNEQLAAADRVRHAAELRRGWHSFAESFRSVFHKDAAPRFVAQRNLEHLQSMMNEILQMFDTPFRVAADEGLSFQASFAAGSRQPAERLSGGQKVILALAFRLALNLMFAENIGALYLDEPTAWLDEHHIRGFEPVLQQLRDFSTARGLQTIIITHERALAPLFDTVVQL